MPELDRRDFLKIVGAGAGAAATVGCEPVEKLVPYVVQPDVITPGIPVVYASTCRECSAACAIHVKTREARPIKVEGNPKDPISKGTLCARGQSSIVRTYHPDRIAGPLVRRGAAQEPTTWEEALRSLTDRINALRQQSGSSKVRVLGGDRGPTLNALIDRWLGAIGGDASRQHLYFEPFEQGALRAAATAVFGVSSVPLFDLSGADVIVDFGSDFLDGGSSPVEHARQLAEARDLAVVKDGGARLVAVGPRMNLTVSNADEWLATAPGHEGRIALALARLVYDDLLSKGRSVSGDASAVNAALNGVSPAGIAGQAGIEPAALTRLAKRLLAAKSPVALPPGIGSQTATAVADAAAVLLLNSLLGAVGRSVTIAPSDAVPAGATLQQIERLVADMNAGRVDVLLIHDANPVHALPAASGFAEALGKVGMVVSLASMKDETSEAASLVLPDHAPFESWGDASPRAGIRTVVQPTVRPLHDTRALGDTLLDVGRGLGDDVAARLPSGSFHNVLKQAWAGRDWRKVLSEGGVWGAAPANAAGPIAPTLAQVAFSPPKLEGSGDLAVIAYPRALTGDGSGAALPWMQETPDPVVKASWISWAEISNATAARLGVGFGEVIAVSTDAGKVELPAYPRGGVRDDVVAIAIGQGHSVGYYASREGDGRPGEARGVNVASILPARKAENGSQAWLATRASVSKTGAFQRIPISQWTDNQRQRGLAPALSLADLAHGDDHHGDDHHGGGNVARDHFVHVEGGLAAPFDAANDADPESPYRWGMAIDNDRCNGCSACVVACAVENNVPTVGEDNAIRHREMTWIRIERYIGDGDNVGGGERRGWPNREELGKVDVRHVPMLCQHCGAAPCESVCPVIATYHNPEGLNGMVYNRCVGTRYCANNCVYKIRRFNYFDYGNDNFPGLMALGLNPDVTVRGQGVMEKCHFCVQRIEAARQPAKDEGRNIAEGEVIAACQQSCPTQAITFGNLRDSGSAVAAKSGEKARAYWSLYTLNTRPAITYLAQVDREADGESHG